MSEEEKNIFELSFLYFIRKIGWVGNIYDLNESFIDLKSIHSIDAIHDSLYKLGYQCVFKRRNLQSMEQEHFPCVILSDMKVPLVVVGRISDGRFTLYNPLSNCIEEHYVPNKSFYSCAIKRNIFVKDPMTSKESQWFSKLLNPFKRIITLGAVLSISISVLDVLAPILVILIISQIASFAEKEVVMQIGYGLGLYVIALFLFKSIRLWMQTYIAGKVGSIVRKEVARRIFYLPPSLTERADLATQIARIKDFRSIQDFISGQGLERIYEIPFQIILLIALAFIGGKIAFVPIAGIAVSLIVSYAISIALNHRLKDSLETSKSLHEYVLDSFSNSQGIAAIGKNDFWIQRFMEKQDLAILHNRHVQQITNVGTAASNFIVSATGLAAMLLGVHMVLEGNMSVPALLASILLVWKILSPLGSFTSMIAQSSRFKKNIKQLNKLMGLSFEREDSFHERMHFRLKGEVEFKQVSLRYTKFSTPALLGVSFHVNQGESLVIIGQSGSGSTSILKLILSIHNPLSGRVIIDGLNTRQMDSIDLRRKIAYMPEQPFAFEGTIRSNFLLANPLATEQDIEDAISETGLFEEIDALEHGLDTNIDHIKSSFKGSSFLKRLSLSLMFCKESSLWLLDNPGLGLENMHERQLLATLGAIRGSATMIIATQNMDYLTVADKVLWLEKGRVKFFGEAKAMEKNDEIFV